MSRPRRQSRHDVQIPDRWPCLLHRIRPHVPDVPKADRALRVLDVDARGYRGSRGRNRPDLAREQGAWRKSGDRGSRPGG
jgi:hypothetical protein